MSHISTRSTPTATIGLLTTPNVQTLPIIASVAQLMRIPVTFNNLKTQALVDTGAAASFLAHRLLVCISYNYVKEVQVSDPNTQPRQHPWFLSGIKTVPSVPYKQSGKKTVFIRLIETLKN
jgi:hypothetical protein